jgi:hypothetical protein
MFPVVANELIQVVSVECMIPDPECASQTEQSNRMMVEEKLKYEVT